MSPATLRSAEIRGACVRFVWSDGLDVELASAWLLDNAPSDADRLGGHRVRTAHSLLEAGPLDSVACSADAAVLSFAHDTVRWPQASLRRFAVATDLGGAADGPVLWRAGGDILERPRVDVAAYLADDDTLRAALVEVVRFGIVRLTGAGLEPEAIEAVVRRFGVVRETKYGRLFEVRVVPDPAHLADTAGALEPHTDNPYREPPPTLQILAGVRDASIGGETFFLDGFALAEDFRRSHPGDFHRLSTLPVPFAYRTARGERFRSRSPVIRLRPDGSIAGLRYNHRALDAVDLAPATTAAWYDSYLKFTGEAEAPERRFAMRLAPGEMVLFDNERLLHGRTAFAEVGARLLRGCYADRDGLLATLERLRRRL